MSQKRIAHNAGNRTPKKLKTDPWKSTLSTYLKQKQYEEEKSFKPTNLVQSSKEFVLQNVIEGDLESSNCFTFSNVVCINNNPQIFDQQFSKFSQFIESQGQPILTELKRFYGPIICHSCIELLKAREPNAAMDFLKKYAHLVAAVDTYGAPLPNKHDAESESIEDNLETTATSPHTTIKFVDDLDPVVDCESKYFTRIIEVLSACRDVNDVESDPQLAGFRSSKYEIHTSEEVVNSLVQFLQKQGHVIIFNLLSTWVHISVMNNEISTWTESNLFFEREDDVEMDKVGDLDTDKELPLDDKSQRLTKELNISTNMRPYVQNFLEAKEEILKAQTEFCRFIKLADRHTGLTSADVDANECHIVAGYNNSVVQLWQINQQSCNGKSIYGFSSDSSCSWELNNCLKEEENGIEIDIQAHRQGSKNWRHIKYEHGKYEDNTYNDYGGIQLRGHGLGVTDVQFSSHFPLIYSVSKDTTMRCWQADSLKCAAIYRGHRFPIWCLDESTVRMYLATGSKDLTARIWTLDCEYPLITFTGHTQDIECIAFHPNGNYFATGSADLSVRLWCIASGKLMRVFHEFKQPITSIKFSPNGRFLAVGGEEMKVHVFDLAVGAQFVEFKEHTSCISSIAWSHCSKYLGSVCTNGSFYLWDVEKIKPIYENVDSNAFIPAVSTITRPSLQYYSNCQRIVKVLYGRSNAFCGIGC